jgi:ribosomal protein S18 acetylase RimI-like enzyme
VGQEGLPVGALWFAVETRFDSRVAYVYDIVIHESHRRRGHATRAFKALEDDARALGLAGIALHVFGHNTQAQALYAKLGYGPTNIELFKLGSRSSTCCRNGRSAPTLRGR